MVVGEQSLQDVLNVVASGLTTGEVIPQFKNPKNCRTTGTTHPTLTEFEAFTSLDPLLADLQKQYLDAKGQRLQAIREFGVDDAMTDMAIYNEDSAWCAVQTRYMEVRADRALMREAQIMMQESVEEERAEEQRVREKESLKTFMQLQIYQRMHEVEKKDSQTGWWWLFYLLATQSQEQLRQPLYAFNRLAA